jgi:hypothetical protein
MQMCLNPLNAELNSICHLLALLGGATIVVVSRIRVKTKKERNVRKRYKDRIKMESQPTNY